MTTSMKGPEGSTSVNVGGAAYECNEDGLFDIEHPDHVAKLRTMGFVREDESRTVSAQLSNRWPLVTRQMTEAGMNLAGCSSGDHILDIIERTATAALASEDAEDEDPPVSMLLGSNILPSDIDVGAEETVQLGTVVARAHEESGLTVVEWNELPEQDIEDRLQAVVDAMIAENAPPAEDENSDGETEEDPPAALADIDKMNRGDIHEWLEKNGGTELKANDKKDDLVTAAETRADELIAAASAKTE